MQCPIIINCRDRVTALASLVGWLEKVGQDEIYLLDNDSSYPPLLEYYEKTPHEVIRLRENLGHLALWLSDALSDRLATAEYYVYTDPDIVPISECPPDALEFFAAVLDRHPWASKVGFGLRIDDLPEHYRFRNEVIRWERQFWAETIAPGLYRAPIDTTFALYRKHSGHDLDRAIRTGYPYLARHLAWYIDSANPGEEEDYYREHARGDIIHWSAAVLPAYLVERIAQTGTTTEVPPHVGPHGHLTGRARLRPLVGRLLTWRNIARRK